MSKSVWKKLLVLALLPSWAACNGGGSVETRTVLPGIRDVQASSWERLTAKRIFFAHQSVGSNIMEGVADLVKSSPQIRLHVVETTDAGNLEEPAFAHARLGQNLDPYSKIRAFSGVMEEGIGDRVDVAFFKFCYLDIHAKTDVEKVFAEYRDTLSRLKDRYPRTTFLHVTVPLCVTRTTWKTGLKKLMGKKEMWEFDDNGQRNAFNERLLKEYQGKEPVFDLARAESTHPDGRRASFKKGGQRYFSLVPEYTRDGGHLNEAGRTRVAEQLLILLAEMGSKTE